MQEIFATRARTADGWQNNVSVRVLDGTIADVTPDTTPATGSVRVDTLLPALSNLHSHSFQRAMAGMTEVRAPGKDSFWTWRSLMYRFLDHLTPEHYQAIAALVFMEMQEAGYAAVAEFHYVHHQPGGVPYSDIAELSRRVLAAAGETGIGLTHLPVLYSYGGAGRQALSGGQLRFANSVERYGDLVSALRKSDLPADTRTGIAPHSLRATSPEDLAAVLALRHGDPVHVHIAEQPREVAEIKAWLGTRPVEWLLANAPVDPDWCLIHATHMTDVETVALAHSGAVAGLCPITESNLGDGPFNGPGFLKAGGRFGVGSDSNVRISLTEELRTLEYSQRLRDLGRNIFIAGEGSVGEAIYLGAAQGGAQALGRQSGNIAPGQLADLVAIDSADASLCALRPDQLLDGLVFAAHDRVVTDVWSAGRHNVQSGRHVRHDAITAGYRAAMADLSASL